jgi:peptide-methionine (S)-S-oxide reductase
MKKIITFTIIAIFIVIQGACKPSNKKNKENEPIAQKEQTPVQVEIQDGFERAYFASGCFWCVEAIYESIEGVKESISGYSGGFTENPTYEASNTGLTGHAEAVEIIYDASVISFSKLVDVYFGSQNISQVNGQGPDHGSQYRSIIFYQNQGQKKIIDTKISELEKTLGEGNVAAQVVPFKIFWVAEEYHQNYERLHPENPYIQNISIPRLKRFQNKFPELLKEQDKH